MQNHQCRRDLDHSAAPASRSWRSESIYEMTCSIIAAFQRTFAYDTFVGVVLTISAILIMSSALLWIWAAARSWRQGQRLQSLDQALLGLLMEVVIAQPVVSQLGLYSPGVGRVFLALLGTGFALAALTFWGHWRRHPQGKRLALTVARLVVVAAFLALGLAHAYVPSTMPRPL